MIKSKKTINRILDSKYPITLLTMEPMKTKMSIDRIDISIEYDNGLKYITDDFYKHISTVEEL